MRRAPTSAAAPLLLAALAALCGNCTSVADRGFGVALTIQFDASISNAQLATVTRLQYDTTGEETESDHSDLTRPPNRTEQVVYRPLATTRVLTIGVTALDDAGVVIGRGSTGMLTVHSGRTTTASVLVAAPGANDLGIDDLGTNDLAGRDLSAEVRDGGNRDGAEGGDAGDLAVPVHFELRINVNGPAWTGIDYPGNWVADQPLDSGVRTAANVCQPNYSRYPGAIIHNTNDAPLFRGEAWGNPLVCTVGAGAIPPGTYQVNLYFAEVYFGDGCPGVAISPFDRIFDVTLEGMVVEQGIDLLVEGDGCAASTTTTTGHPVVKHYSVQILDGTLDINMPASQNNAKISAIEIIGPT